MLRARGAPRATIREKGRFLAGNAGLFFNLVWLRVARGGRAGRNGHGNRPRPDFIAEKAVRKRLYDPFAFSEKGL